MRDGCNSYFLVWAILCPFTPPPPLPNDPKIKNFKKMRKTPEGIIILHMCTKNKNNDHDLRFLKYGARRTGGRTDGNKEVTYRGGCPT